MHPIDSSFSDIAEAFSLTAEKYDRFAEDHPNLTRIRKQVYNHLQSYLAPGAYILELNAGTGTDAVHLARQGFKILATDIAPGMLQRLDEKVSRLGLDDRITVKSCSFTELEKVEEGPFDAVFSDLGGLNCIPDLGLVIEKLPLLLKPGGIVTWVLMPTICLWELAMAFTGDFRFAFRRLSPKGTRAHLEGKYFQIYYFTPSQAARAFDARFRLLEIEGLSVFAPPAESKNLAIRHNRIYTALCALDKRLASRPPFWGWGDFFIISLRYEPGKSAKA
jgi:ubiquinone/menaquinone biosynthesis C-methylase UbiE